MASSDNNNVADTTMSFPDLPNLMDLFCDNTELIRFMEAEDYSGQVFASLEDLPENLTTSLTTLNNMVVEVIPAPLEGQQQDIDLVDTPMVVTASLPPLFDGELLHEATTTTTMSDEEPTTWPAVATTPVQVEMIPITSNTVAEPFIPEDLMFPDFTSTDHIFTTTTNSQATTVELPSSSTSVVSEDLVPLEEQASEQLPEAPLQPLAATTTPQPSTTPSSSTRLHKISTRSRLLKKAKQVKVISWVNTGAPLTKDQVDNMARMYHSMHPKQPVICSKCHNNDNNILVICTHFHLSCTECTGCSQRCPQPNCDQTTYPSAQLTLQKRTERKNLNSFQCPGLACTVIATREELYKHLPLCDKLHFTTCKKGAEAVCTFAVQPNIFNKLLECNSVEFRPHVVQMTNKSDFVFLSYIKNAHTWSLYTAFFSKNASTPPPNITIHTLYNAFFSTGITLSLQPVEYVSSLTEARHFRVSLTFSDNHAQTLMNVNPKSPMTILLCRVTKT